MNTHETRHPMEGQEYVHATLWPGSTGERRRFVQGSDYSVRASLMYWSDGLQAAPAEALAVSPVVAKMCSKCWPKCYWMHCWYSLRFWEGCHRHRLCY